MDTNTIGWRLDKAMQDARIKSQAQLARLSGVPQPTINRILNGEGKRGPETGTLVALANATGVEFLWLQQGRGPQRPGEPVEAGDEARNDEKARLRVVEQSESITLQWVTDREAELLSEFRACDERFKKDLLAAARGLPKVDVVIAARDKAQPGR
jgi:transcriptional regulator with XRE-family HTH domain